MFLPDKNTRDTVSLLLSQLRGGIVTLKCVVDFICADCSSLLKCSHSEAAKANVNDIINKIRNTHPRILKKAFPLIHIHQHLKHPDARAHTLMHAQAYHINTNTHTRARM